MSKARQAGRDKRGTEHSEAASKRHAPKGIYRPPGAKHWLYDFWVAGQRYVGSTGCVAEAEAQANADAIRANAPRNRGGPASADMTWIEGVGRYMREKGCRTKAPATLEESFHLLTDRIGPNTRLRDIDNAVLTNIIFQRMGDHRWGDKEHGLVSPARVNRSVPDLVKRITTRARKYWGVALPNEPVYADHILDEEPREREMGEEEERRLRRDQREDLLEFVDFLLASGIRISAALITWDQVDWRNMVIRVRRLKRKQKKAVQEIPITPEIERILRAQQDRHETYVFTYLCRMTQKIGRTARTIFKGKRYPLTYEGFSSSWEDMCGRQNVVDLRPHDLRKTAGSRMLRATGNIAVVSKFLGHSDVRMTMRFYAFVAGDDVRKAMEQTERLYSIERFRLAA